MLDLALFVVLEHNGEEVELLGRRALLLDEPMHGRHALLELQSPHLLLLTILAPDHAGTTAKAFGREHRREHAAASRTGARACGGCYLGRHRRIRLRLLPAQCGPSLEFLR